MGQKLSPPDMELYRIVDEVLHYVWDPIGVSTIPMARDEYHGYLPQVFQLLKTNANAESISKYLHEVVTERMGMTEDINANVQVAELLLEWQEVIREKNS